MPRGRPAAPCRRGGRSSPARTTTGRPSAWRSRPDRRRSCARRCRGSRRCRRSVLELLARLHHLDRLLLAERERHAVRAGVLRAEDELVEVGGAARNRDVVREGRLALVDRLEEPDQRGRGGEVDADEADLVDVLVDERLRQQERDAGAGRVERIGVRVAPVVLGDVRRDPGDLRRWPSPPTRRA